MRSFLVRAPAFRAALALAGALVGAACSTPGNQEVPLDLGGDGAGGGAGDPGASGPSGSTGSGTGASSGTGSGASSGTGTGAGSGSGTGTGGAGAGAGTGAGSGSGANGGGDWLVYASTDDSLFALDPTDPALALQKVGDFDCVGANGPYSAMLDVAVDRFQHLYGVTSHAVVPLLPANGKVLCGQSIPLTSADPNGWLPAFYALTFAPLGVLDPLKEVLVAGNSAGELWAIDAAGSATVLGDFGVVPPDDGHGHVYDPAHVGKAWELSGDIVFLANDGEPVGFATVRDCPDPPSTYGCSKHDTLIEVDMQKLKSASPGVVTKAVRGKIVKKIGCGADGIVAGSFFGIGAWNDAVFGFSRGGGLVRVLTSDAGGCLVKNYPQYPFSGAGVTTLAPIDVPPLQ